MSYKKRTLRRMPPTTRELAKIINEVKSVLTRLEHRLQDVASLELDSIALAKMNDFMKAQKEAKNQPAKTEPLFPESGDQGDQGHDAGDTQAESQSEPVIKAKRTRKHIKTILESAEADNAESQTEPDSTRPE